MSARRPNGTMRILALAGVALACLGTPAWAQDAADPSGDPDNPVLNRGARSNFGLDRNSSGLPTLRGSRGNTAPSTAGQPSAPFPTTGDATAGNAAAGETSSGLSGGGEGLSQLPRFRSNSGQSISSLSGTPARTTPTLLRQRAAPPRRIGSATRVITQTRTQAFTQDLRLSPVIQPAVSGVPLPVTTSPLARSIPMLGLLNPGGALIGTTVARGPNDPDPAYAPLGIKVGSITLFPAFSQWIGYDSNPAQTPNQAARGSFASRSEAELTFRSDWSTSALTGELRGGYLEFPDNDTASRPNASGTTRLRVDVTRETLLDAEAHFNVDTQRLGSVDLGVVSATSRPAFATYGGSVGVTQSINRLQLTLRGGIDRQVFEDARLSDGSTLVQSDRNANQYQVRLRAGYEISPSITPFVETILDTRVYDTPVDQSGLRRDSDGIAFTGGATVQLTRTLSGEISAGIQKRDYVDRSLRAISAPLVNTALIWAASPLTTVRLSQQTGVIETSVPGSSGAFTDIATLEVQHDLLRNLSVTVGGGYLSTNYEGVRIKETGYSALVRADYRVNRWLTFRGSYTFQTLASSAQNASYTDNIFLLGVRINP